MPKIPVDPTVRIPLTLFNQVMQHVAKQPVDQVFQLFAALNIAADRINKELAEDALKAKRSEAQKNKRAKTPKE